MKFNLICDTLLIALFGSAICLPLVKADFRGGGGVRLQKTGIFQNFRKYLMTAGNSEALF